MTKEEIIEMAEQAGFMFDRGSPIGFTHSMLKDFAKLVAEKATAELRADIKINQRNLLQKITKGQE